MISEDYYSFSYYESMGDMVTRVQTKSAQNPYAAFSPT